MAHLARATRGGVSIEEMLLTVVGQALRRRVCNRRYQLAASFSRLVSPGVVSTAASTAAER